MKRPRSEVRRPTSTPRVHIEYGVDGVGLPDFDTAQVLAAVTAAVAAHATRRPRGGFELAVLFVDDARSADMHGEHFADPTPTDVMSFPDGTPDPESGRLRLGDLAVGVDVAERVARERGRPLAEELVLYILHGTLHLLGLDDIDDADRAAMWAEQRRILAPLGIEIGEEGG